MVRLDYSDADVSVEVAGLPVEASSWMRTATPSKSWISSSSSTTRTTSSSRRARPALLQLDFDLAASHEVDITTTPATAIGEPFLVATIVPVDDREFRVRGPLVSVDEAAGSYIVDLRPFNHPDAKLGRFTVADDRRLPPSRWTATSHRQAPTALPRMADAGAGTLTAAQGILDVATRAFTADSVLAGDSVPGANFDVVHRQRDRARRQRAHPCAAARSSRRDDRCLSLRGDITVEIGPNTVVTKEGGGGDTLDTDAISVGQRIHAFGAATVLGP